MMLIGFAPRGGADLQARLIAEELAGRHGWVVEHENVAGKGGADLTHRLKDAPKDGTVNGIPASIS